MNSSMIDNLWAEIRALQQVQPLFILLIVYFIQTLLEMGKNVQGGLVNWQGSKLLYIEIVSHCNKKNMLRWYLFSLNLNCPSGMITFEKAQNIFFFYTVTLNYFYIKLDFEG